jgi:hypothetical protein
VRINGLTVPFFAIFLLLIKSLQFDNLRRTRVTGWSILKPGTEGEGERGCISKLQGFNLQAF